MELELWKYKMWTVKLIKKQVCLKQQYQKPQKSIT